MRSIGQIWGKEIISEFSHNANLRFGVNTSVFIYMKGLYTFVYKYNKTTLF